MTQNTFIRPKWDTYFLELAKTVATRSHDLETQVGVVIINPEKRILATGYNGFPAGADDAHLPKQRPEKYPFMIHAELNAIVSSPHDLRGCTLYSTISPCEHCAKIIVTAGIQEVVFETEYTFGNWDFVKKLFEIGHVRWRKIQST